LYILKANPIIVIKKVILITVVFNLSFCESLKAIIQKIRDPIIGKRAILPNGNIDKAKPNIADIIPNKINNILMCLIF